MADKVDPASVAARRAPSDVTFLRVHVDLTVEAWLCETIACADLDDALGGIGRAMRLLEEHDVDDAYAPSAPVIVNLGLLSGSPLMTGLRTFIHGYSPLKVARSGRPGAMWSAGSGMFGTKLRGLGVDEIVVTGRAAQPTLLRLSLDASGALAVEFLDAAAQVGLTVNERIQGLHGDYPNAHFAVIGPAGEAWRDCRFAAIALSSENQLRSGDAKPRFCGRGGFGGVFGSKNLFGLVADGPNPPKPPRSETVIAVNKLVATGRGSARFREGENGGGTWANYETLVGMRALPEENFSVRDDEPSRPLIRGNVEKGPFEVVAESCHRCGIRCHKNVHDREADGSRGRFRAKLDYEPLNLLSSNLGIYEPDDACTLVALVDEMGLDSISCGTTLSYVMEWNRRHPDRPLVDGLAFGDVDGVLRAIEGAARGALPALGQGVARLARSAGDEEYAMHVKGVELPAYLPQTNPGYPWALAGGHMSMRTYLLLAFERETGLDYWVDAIAERGWRMLRDDLLGACKFSGLDDGSATAALRAITGLDVTVDDLVAATRRTFLRGIQLERKQGFVDSDYALPAEAMRPHPHIGLPQFVTPEFMDALRERVTARIDEMLAAEAGLGDTRNEAGLGDTRN